MNSLVVTLALCAAALSCVAAQQQAQQRYAQILRHSSDASPDGQFQYGFQTEDGISAEARGTPVRSSSSSRDEGGAATAVTGQYSYTGPDGQVYTVSYVADENGYRASGAHLPQPPPVPEAIQQSLLTIARSSPRADDSVSSFQPQSFQQAPAPAAPAFQAFQQRAAPAAPAFQSFQQRTSPAAPAFQSFQQRAAPAAPAFQSFQQRAAPAAPAFQSFQQRAAPAAPAFQSFQQRAAPAAPAFQSFPQQAAPVFQSFQQQQPQAFQGSRRF